MSPRCRALAQPLITATAAGLGAPVGPSAVVAATVGAFLTCVCVLEPHAATSAASRIVAPSNAPHPPIFARGRVRRAGRRPGAPAVRAPRRRSPGGQGAPTRVRASGRPERRRLLDRLPVAERPCDDRRERVAAPVAVGDRPGRPPRPSSARSTRPTSGRPRRLRSRRSTAPAPRSAPRAPPRRSRGAVDQRVELGAGFEHGTGPWGRDECPSAPALLRARSHRRR